MVVVLSQDKGIRERPHIHYVALSRVKQHENLYILNMNEGAIDLDKQVTSGMHRLRTEASLELCNVLLYKIIIWKAQGVPQLNNVAHPKHPEEEETSLNRNHIITGKQQQKN